MRTMTRMWLVRLARHASGLLLLACACSSEPVGGRARPRPARTRGRRTEPLSADLPISLGRPRMEHHFQWVGHAPRRDGLARWRGLGGR